MLVVDDDARAPLGWLARVTGAEPGGEVFLEVDNDSANPLAMEWLGDPVLTTVNGAGVSWSQHAQTTRFLVGSSVTPTGEDVALPAGRHVAQVHLRYPDGRVLPGPSFIFEVR